MHAAKGQPLTDLNPISPSIAVENFVKAVYRLQQQHERVSTNVLSDALAISAPSVTDMAQRLVAAELVDYQKYRGVILTAKGEALALRVLRRHRLIELFLMQELGYALHEVHHEAEELEHAVSDRFVDALAEKMGNPSFDPHGDPIPAADGSMSESQTREMISLNAIPLHTSAQVAQLRTSRDDMLEHLIARGLSVGAAVIVLRRDPFEGPVYIRVSDRAETLGYHAAECVLVTVG
jgi:DtxR family transcriptional regulator, Mn-dependent transcriptional regulator